MEETLKLFKSGTLEFNHEPVKMGDLTIDKLRESSFLRKKVKSILEFNQSGKENSLVRRSLGEIDLLNSKLSDFTKMKEVNANRILVTETMRNRLRLGSKDRVDQDKMAKLDRASKYLLKTRPLKDYSNLSPLRVK